MCEVMRRYEDIARAAGRAEGRAEGMQQGMQQGMLEQQKIDAARIAALEAELALFKNQAVKS